MCQEPLSLEGILFRKWRQMRHIVPYENFYPDSCSSIALLNHRFSAHVLILDVWQYDQYSLLLPMELL